MTHTSWYPSLGAWLEDGGARFRLWAPERQRVELLIEGHAPITLEPGLDGYHSAFVEGLAAGDRYQYRLDGDGPFPDPASRYLPEGVHGPSEIVDPRYAWTDDGWTGLDPDRTVLYELHIGTFTPEGTFAAAADRLEHLASLGVTAIQVMPIADFAGDRNWGYDAVALFAPARAYGRPDDLRALVDRAHAVGLGVVLDVVYNHFGPDGAYHAQFSPSYFTERHHTPWGAAINLDGERSEAVRAFFIESALHWMHEYHVDGFRLDAVHTLIDDSDYHFLAEYRDRTASTAREGQPAPLLVAEEHRNLAHVVRPREHAGYGFDITYSDDFHHEMRRLLSGLTEGYFADYRGSAVDVAAAMRDGWIYHGQYSRYQRSNRGTPSTGIPLPRFLHALQNHDQVGNRPFGERVYHEVSEHTFRAATALLLFGAATPALFMGDEWICRQPFLYFTDHHDELGELVREGRRAEFRDWGAFSDPRLRSRIPDPQAASTFDRSRLDWDELEREPHAAFLRWHRALLALRHERWERESEPASADAAGASIDEPSTGAAPSRAARVAGSVTGSNVQSSRTIYLVDAPDEATVLVRFDHHHDGVAPGDGGRHQGNAPVSELLVARLAGAGPLASSDAASLLHAPDGTNWEPLLSSEDGAFVANPLPIEFGDDADGAWCHFRRPGALILRSAPAATTHPDPPTGETAHDD